MSQEQLKPCPFCGCRAEFNEHTPECYFSKLADVKKAPKGDVACVIDLIPAWNARATQPGQIVAPSIHEQDAKAYKAILDEARAALGLRDGDSLVAAIQQLATADPLDTPLPCDIRVGHVTHKKGVPLRSLVTRMEALAAMVKEFSPLAPAAAVSDAVSTVRERYRGTKWGKAAECICDAVDEAIFALRPAQAGVPDDIVKNAQRYRWLRDNGGDWAVCSWGEDDGGAWFRDSRPPTVVDRAIDTAMLAAAPKEGGAA